MGWNEEKADLLWALRDAYNEEIGRLAEELRPRFEAGELRGYNGDDDEHEEGERERFFKPGVEFKGAWEAWRTGRRPTPFEKLEEIVERHFGLQVTEGKRGEFDWLNCDDGAIHAILAVSHTTDDVAGEDWDNAAAHAVHVAAWDVLLAARRRGYYVPRADEAPHPGHYPSKCYCGRAA